MAERDPREFTEQEIQQIKMRDADEWSWIDDHGFNWVWSREEMRLYCLEAEREMDDPAENGYRGVYSPEQAQELLVEMGYIEEVVNGEDV